MDYSVGHGRLKVFHPSPGQDAPDTMTDTLIASTTSMTVFVSTVNVL